MKEPRLCDYCQVPYVPIRSTSRFCSKSCCASADWSRKISEKPRTKSYRQAALSRKIPLTQQQRQVVLGSLLGDGCVLRTKHGHVFAMTHSEAQREYLLWKSELLGSLIQATPKVSNSSYLGTPTKQVSVQSIKHPDLTSIYELAYPDNTKTVSIEWLNEIDSLGLAIWYMDDGSFMKNYHSRQIVLCTESFETSETELLRDWLYDKWKVETVLQPQKVKSGQRLRLRINRTKVSSFIDIVQTHIHPTMRYKLPEQVVFPAD